MFLKVSQNSQENTCIGASFFNRFTCPRAATLSKKETPIQVFSCKICVWILQIKIKASENEISNRWFYLFWSFIYKSYRMVTNIRRPANKFVKPCYWLKIHLYSSCYLWLNCIRLWFVCSCLWLFCDLSIFVCDSSVTCL